MTGKILRGLLCGALGVMMVSSALAGKAPRPLTDNQLDAVYAAGFDVRVDMGVSVDASKPDSVVVQGGDMSALQEFLNQGMTLAQRSGGMRNEGSFDPTGAYTTNLGNVTVNTINITDNALRDATTLLNVFALEGDVAVGVNLNVIVNPVNTILNVAQNNVNWGSLTLPDGL